MKASSKTKGRHVRRKRILLGPLLIALAALAAIIATIAPDGSGPGVTCDEPYHVYQGKQLVTALQAAGIGLLSAGEHRAEFRVESRRPAGPGAAGLLDSRLDALFVRSAPDNPDVISIRAARFAPAVAFALLVLMVGAWTGRREGPLAGTVAAAAVALMPRLFGHAHLAALDMLTTLFFVAAVLAVTEAVRGGRVWHYAAAGAVWARRCSFGCTACCWPRR